ncbi:cobyrinate a,c-diamide synthase [Streptomyces sp. NPDC051940]|uniref:cobyrinate a,c-diamide synthase n=1 Tax=Streptomyces sp. NPDC051940 TaxID=3155675 RepID=UPI0034172553
MVSTTIPRLVIAAPASGSGKTTVATGLMAAFTEAGLTVSPHKVGPDYIDPGYHTLAVSSPKGVRPGRNLDAYMCGPELIAPLFLHGAAGADLALVEGVMGLYDGAAGHGELGSTAHVAKLLRAPVVLVVDASSQSRSVAALVHGFASWDPEVRLAGVILNKVASARHEELLHEALTESGVPVLGTLRRTPHAETPSRHLGLIPAAERSAEARASVKALAAQIRDACDLQALLSTAHSAPPLSAEPWSPQAALGARGADTSQPAPDAEARSAIQARPASEAEARSADTARPASEAEARSANQARPAFEARGAERRFGGPGAEPPQRDATSRPRIALAGGPAFTFSYAEHEELLTAAGADVTVFDPLNDESLPEGTTGLIIGGGFPEMHAQALSANKPLRTAVAALAARGAPIAAECAGLLYLCRSLDGEPMCGVLDADATMTDHLTLGYREAVALTDNPLAAAGTRVRGHEFHRTTVEPQAGTTPAWGIAHPAPRRKEGFVKGGVHAAYLHTHWAATPFTAARLVERCRV